MKIKDLQPYDYMGKIEQVKSVGWLEGNFPKGETDPKLVELLEKFPVINKCRGFHLCEYCDDQIKDGKIVGETGNGEIWIVGKDQIYAAPSLIIHYIKDHNYLPPQEFIDSVFNGISSESDLYQRKIEEAKETAVYKQSTYEETLSDVQDEMVKNLSKEVDSHILKELFKKGDN